METIESILKDTVNRITTTVRANILSQLGVSANGKIAKGVNGAKPRKKGPIQLCPAPGCKSPAAPVFGMLCAKHKETPKATVAKWHEARRKKNASKAKS